MYQEYYGMREMPFNITPDPKFFYLGQPHHEALQHIKTGIDEKKGLMVLTGEVGCGKTTFCQRLLNELPETNYNTVLILNPRITENQLLRAILNEFGIENIPRGRNELIDKIADESWGRIMGGREVVLIIDESQNLSLELLEQIQSLSGLETSGRKLIQIILIGRPELLNILMQPSLEQLQQHVLVSYELPSLNYDDTIHYMHHRLALAGAEGRPFFTRHARRKIHKASRGAPRLINNLCDKALLSAYVRSSDTVTYWDVVRARKELQY